MTILLTIILVLLIFFSGFLSASETSLFSLTSMKVRSYSQSHDKKKKMVAHLLKSPRELLVTILMLNVAMNIFVQNSVSSIFDNFPGWFLSVGLPLVLTLIFGEVIPKSIAITNNAKIATFVAPFIFWSKKLLGPLRIIISKITSGVSRFLFFFLQKEPKISVSEIKHALNTSKEFGLLHEDEAKLLQGYLKLEEITVKEVMRPRQDMIYFDILGSLDHLLHLFVDEECSRIPICREELDELLGILPSDQYFIYKDRIESPSDLIPILDKPFYVPQTITAKQLFSQFREKQETFAIVVDEYGSIVGLITKEDLVEIVFGQIEDKRDPKELYVRSAKDVIIANGKMELVEVEEIFDVYFDNPNNLATIGGWLIDQMQDIPKNGTKHVTKDFLFYILSAAPNKINRVYIRKLKNKPKRKIN